MAVALLVAASAGVILFGRHFAEISGLRIEALEVAGTAARARAVRGDVSVDAIERAIRWDYGLIVGYAVLLGVAAWFFAGRAFRVRRFREFRPTAVGLILLAAGLDAVENVCMLLGLRVSGDLPWQAAATAAWAKFAILIGMAAYVAIAAFTYLVTPDWVQQLIMSPARPNIGLSPSEALRPEGHLHHQRRAGERPQAPLPPARFGIAVSGGGVRSASLALGSLQVLEQAYGTPDSCGPSWSTADKVASVSGGSYLAGAFSISRSKRIAGSPAPAPCADAWTAGRAAGFGGQPVQSPEEYRLLTRLGYLLAPNPRGWTKKSHRKDPSKPEQNATRDVPGAVALVVVGLALNLAVLLSLLWLLVQPYAWLLASGALDCPAGPPCAQVAVPVGFWGAAAVCVLLVWVGAGWARAAVRPGSDLYRLLDWLNRHGRSVVFGLVLLTSVLGILLLGGPLLVAVLPGEVSSQVKTLTPAAVLAGLGSLLALARGLRGHVVRFAPLVGGLLFVVLLVLCAVQFLLTAPSGPSARSGWLVAAAGWLLLYTFVSGEWWSLAGFYRARLRFAFATYRAKNSSRGYLNGNWPAGLAEPSIYEFEARGEQDPDGSPLQICATAHATGPDIRTHYGIPALSVTISSDWFRVNLPTNDEGGWSAQEASTRAVEALLYRRGAPRLTTMLAVGVSGAAISPAMGQYRIGPARALLAAANVRLGVWIPNPRYAARADLTLNQDRVRPDRPNRRVPYPRPRISYLLKEMFGIHDIDDLYLYVTDGGHWENTGVVELLRDRSIDEVVCLDADEGPRERAGEIAAAIGLAKLECNVDIRLSLDPLRGPVNGVRGSDYSQRSVNVGLILRGDQLGLLWYAKPVLAADTPLELLSYAECDATFPATSTINQFFHTAQFEAYRDLGRHNGGQIVSARRELAAAAARARTFKQFQQLARHPTAHWSLTALVDLLDEDKYAQLRALLRRPSNFGRRSSAQTRCAASESHPRNSKA